MKANYQKLKCCYCGKRFKSGNDRNGIPNGIGFVMKSGNTYTVCHSCISYNHDKVSEFIQNAEKSGEMTHHEQF